METCTYGSEGDAWEPTIVIWQGTGYLPYHVKLHTKDTHLNKLEHQIDSNIAKKEKGIINGQVQEQPLTFQERFEVDNQMYPQKRTGIVKKRKEEQEIER
ncbi:hypothetical protein ABE065_01385 [Priestia megaterium]